MNKFYSFKYDDNSGTAVIVPDSPLLKAHAEQRNAQNNIVTVTLPKPKRWNSAKSVSIVIVLMSIALKTTFGQITQVGSTETAYARISATITLNKPTGVKVGDIMIANIVKYLPGNTLNPSLNGWTVIGTSLTGTTGEKRGAVLFKIVDGTEGTNFNFQLSGGDITGWAEGALISYTGIDATNPFDAIPGTITTATNGNVNLVSGITSVTTVTPNALVIMLGMCYRSSYGAGLSFSSWSLATSPTLTEICNTTGTEYVSVGVAVGIQTTPGSTGSGTIEVSGNAYLGGIILALRPEPAAPGPKQITQIGSLETAYARLSATITLNKPAGVQVGDIMIANIIRYMPSNSLNPSLEGWTVIGASLASSSRRGAILYRVVDGTEGASFNFLLLGGDQTGYAEGALIAYTGIDATNPFDAIPGNIITTTNANGSILSGITSVTTVTPNALVVILGMCSRMYSGVGISFSTWSLGTSPGLTEICDAVGTEFVSVGVAAGMQFIPGPTGAGTIGVSDNAYLGGIILALRPAPTLTTYTLTAGNDGHGSVTLSPPGGTYASGTTVTLTPVPNSGYQFSSWAGATSGDIINTSGVYTIVMNDNKAVTGTFTLIPNIALDKAATSQSSTYPQYGPSKANDADGTNSSFWAERQYPQWWKVDLGGVYDISGIVIRNYVDGYRYYQYTIEGSLDDQNYAQVAGKTNTNAATDAGDSYPVTATARYLRVTMTYNSANPGVHITDFRAYGILNTNSWLITASAGAGGSISPSGAVAVINGGSQTFTITPAVGYQISDVLVDGGSVGAVTSYPFNNVTANHTIAAAFAALTNIALNKTATAQSDTYSEYGPSKANDADGTNNSFWAERQYPQWWKVDLGGVYDISAIVIRNYVDGYRYYLYTIEGSLDNQTYGPVEAKRNTNVATDAGDAYLVTTTARYLKVTMSYNSENPGVHISDFRVYGTANTNSWLITASVGTGGSISPTGEVAVINGTNKSFTITPAVGYQISNVLVDGSSVGAVTSYPFTNVTANHTISATFTPLANIALDKPATSQSSTYPQYGPSKANDSDGTNNSFWAERQYPQWWKVDLGGVYDISGIVIRNYVDGYRYYQYTIEGSLDDQTYSQVAGKTNTNVATEAGDAYSVTATARYLRVTMTYNSENPGVHISDFRVYGIVNTNSWLITASAGTGGSISPSGEVAVINGTGQTFTITPAVGYQISDVLVDGGSVGAVTSSPFTNVTANHTISATFTPLANIALDKNATAQSYTYSEYGPSKANDADGTNNSFWAERQYPQWWKVDLGSVYDISGIVIRNYVDGYRYYQYTIEGSLDDQTYGQIATKTNTNVATDAGDGYSVTATARYLRVTMTYNSENPGIHISDFRVYGTGGVKGIGSSDSPSFKQDITTEPLTGDFKLNVYPNPFRDQFTIRIDSPNEEMFDMSLIDLLGGTLYLNTKIPANTENTFSPQVPGGIYVIVVNDKERKIIRRIVKY
jgi:hypothetical protein